MDIQTLFADHVLSNQSTVVEELIYCEKLSCESLYDENCEVSEWWLVTSYLACKLKQQGEIIIDDYGCYWWGRTTSGQTIAMDGVMQTICAC